MVECFDRPKSFSLNRPRGNGALLAGRRDVSPRVGQRRMVMRMLVSQFVRDERGMETVEWGVLAALIVAGLVGVIAGLGGNIKTKFTNLQTATS